MKGIYSNSMTIGCPDVLWVGRLDAEEAKSLLAEIKLVANAENSPKFYIAESIVQGMMNASRFRAALSRAVEIFGQSRKGNTP